MYRYYLLEYCLHRLARIAPKSMSNHNPAHDGMQPSAVHDGGHGSALVLLHGLGGTWEVWRPVLPALEARHRVIALTLPGHFGGPAFAELYVRRGQGLLHSRAGQRDGGPQSQAVEGIRFRAIADRHRAWAHQPYYTRARGFLLP